MPSATLVELYAHGLGVIRDAHLEFDNGFTVLTGETGAGKTLLLGALELCLGAASAPARLTTGADLRAAAVFERDDGTEVALSREWTDSGRLRSSLNGAPSSVEALRAQARSLIVIHGQHDSLALRSKAEILRLIDARTGLSTDALDSARRDLRDAQRLREELGGDPQRRDRELEFARFQLAELEDANIVGADELATTMDALTRVTALRDGQAALAEVIAQLDGDDEMNVLSSFARAVARLPGDQVYDAAREELDRSLLQARDAVHVLRSLADPDAFDASVLADLDDRATLLSRIARKYGGTLDAALTTREDLRRQVQNQARDLERLATIDTHIEGLEHLVRELAASARAARIEGARRLTEAVQGQLTRVALSGASVRFEADGEDGSDARLLFRASPSQAEGPLQALASGGELSRVLLALSLETAHDSVVTVFDEIDAGLGGQVAQQIGECLREVSVRQQVLCVTHLASVAAKADHHFVVEKVVDTTAYATVRRVVGEERVDEIARMLAGDERSEESRALARRMLETRS